MAKRRSQQPSEVAGIGCEVCAYFFDEALMVAEWAAARARAEEDRLEADLGQHHSRMGL